MSDELEFCDDQHEAGPMTIYTCDRAPNHNGRHYDMLYDKSWD